MPQLRQALLQHHQQQEDALPISISAGDSTQQPYQQQQQQHQEPQQHQAGLTPPAPGTSWPRTWQDAASWASRDPIVAGSLQGSYIRSRHPQLLEAEQEARSPHHAAASVFSPATHAGSRRLRRADSSKGPADDDLEEALLFEFESEELSGTATAAAAAASGPPGLPRALSSGASVVLSAAGSLPPGLALAQHSVIKDAGGLHTVAEVFLEEERASSSGWQTFVNATNVLCGVGLLTTPYTMAITGTSALLLLVLIGGIAMYTAHLLALCMATSRSIRSYPDIAEAAFGGPGRVLVSVLLYSELFSCCVDFFILEADNLSAVFPNASLTVGGLHIPAKQVLMLAAALVVLPTVLLRDLSLLSFLSIGGIFASVALLGLVGWEGAAVTGFPHTAPPLLIPAGLPVSLGLYCFCFSGHAVFPSLIASLRNKAQFPRIVAATFGVVILLYGSMAVMGGLMFGSDVSDNITLDMQRVSPRALPTVLSTWLVIVNPISKLALTLAPVAMAAEELLAIRHDSWRFTLLSMALRTGLLAAVVVTAITVPFFSLVMSLIGSVMATSVAIVLPCLFALRLVAGSMTPLDRAAAVGVAAFGVCAGVVGTFNAVLSILSKY